MIKNWLIGLLLFAVLLLAPLPASADTLLYDWAFNFDGTVIGFNAGYAPPAAGELPGWVNAAGFDWTTGLGSLTFDYRPGAGAHKFLVFLDPEIDNALNGPYDEYVPDPDQTRLAAGQSWEVDEPGWNGDPAYPMGDIYDHMGAGVLDNSNGLPFTNPYNVSMALGWDFTLGSGQRAVIHLNTTTSGPPGSGFYLAHHNLGGGDVIYFSGDVNVADIPGPGPGEVPEPGSLLLLGGGLAGLALLRFRRRAVRHKHLASIAVFLALTMALAAVPAYAAPPVVKTPQFVPDQPTSRHPIWCDTPMMLKGTSDQGGNFVWDPADGSGALYSGAISDRYAIQAVHTYTTANGCAVGRIYAAKLTVTNGGGESAQKIYYQEVFNKTLDVEVNRAIDDGLWALHKAMTRWDGAVPFGDWRSWSSWNGMHAASVEAFLAMGHKETGTEENPYTETVRRGINQFFNLLATMGIGSQSLGNPDSNGNGIGITTVQGYRGYQTGMMLGALVATDNPTAIAQAGPANVVGRQYKDIAQDIADWIAWAQYDDVRYGGWRYEYNQWPDNSACQWNAIGLISAEKQWGLTIPSWVKTANNNWLTYSHHPSGWFGYTGTGYEWGGLADTASGMVQAVMDGWGRGDSRWDTAEAWLRSKWDSGTSYAPMRTSYLYAAFSFSKAMLLHNPPITTDFGGDLDWYGDNVKGLARALVNAQYAPPNGYWWYGGQPDGNHYAFMTAWAVMMLNRTVIQTGRPIAIAKAIPLQAIAGQTITLDGSGSYHQAVGRSIVQWDWTIYNGSNVASGVRETKSGRFQTVVYPAVGNYLVKLTVTDDAPAPATAEDFVTVLATIPPVPPVANAGGPYRFCNQATPWILDGSRSYNADEGKHQPGPYPGDFITAYDWDLTTSGTFNDAHGVKPDVTSFFSSWAPGSYVIQLRVTDNTALSFPSSPSGNLAGTAAGSVTLEGNCACVNDLSARVMKSRVDLAWRHVGADQYHIYRKTDTVGWAQIASVNAPISVYTDTPVTNGLKYYYQIKPFKATYDPQEYCTSNTITATAPAGR